ncbi:MAG: DNA repair protein RadC [Gloeobacteraceae cyanobacterium ES-bin-316]|nr:DNA repair protein RadC [Ferruginibacter sp.]
METSKKESSSIKNWSVDDRPREKMQAKGAPALSNSELLAILINNGNKEKSALEIAKEVLNLSQNNLDELGKLTLKDLQKIKGIGEAKAITIAAAMELGRRRQSSEFLSKPVVRSSGEIASFLKAVLKDHPHEVFAVLFLNRANKILHFEIVSTGGLTGTVADPRVILKKAIETGATAIVLSHNHPSGSLKPSRADEDLTQKIRQAATYLDIRVIDHIIVSDEGYFSFADEGLL